MAISKEIDKTKSLQQLECQDWGEPPFDSHLVATCHRLRRIPLNEFTAGDLRIMIDQQISLPNLIPIALEQLEVDPLVDGGYYAGDLLAAILSVDEPFWTARPEMAFRVRAIVERVNALLCDRDEIELRSIRKVLTDGNRSLTE